MAKQVLYLDTATSLMTTEPPERERQLQDHLIPEGSSAVPLLTALIGYITAAAQQHPDLPKPVFRVTIGAEITGAISPVGGINNANG